MSIVVRDLGFSYFDRTVIGGADAEFRPGLIHLLLGATGSGKTTLALLLAGLLKPKQGSVAVDGCDPASDKFERSRLQLAFQFPEAQIFESVVEREIEYGLRNFGFSREEASARRDWAADCVGLSRRLLSKDPAEISFGERRKTALASAIALKPAYLILDEPLAGLDWQGRTSLVATLLRLKGEGLTTLVLTHEADLIAELGDGGIPESGRDRAAAGPRRPRAGARVCTHALEPQVPRLPRRESPAPGGRGCRGRR
jgi:energy-coupling factor transport system ATP-binding protein